MSKKYRGKRKKKKTYSKPVAIREIGVSEDPKAVEEPEAIEEPKVVEESEVVEEPKIIEDIENVDVETAEASEKAKEEVIVEEAETIVSDDASVLIRKKNKIREIVILGTAIAVICAIVGFFYWESTLVWKTCCVEAGVEISPADFMKDASMPASFTEGTEVPDTSIPGEYEVSIDAMHMKHKSLLVVADTILPVAEAEPVSISYGEKCVPEDFIVMSEDATALAYSYEKEPDYEVCGKQDVQISVTDAGGNELVLDSALFISKILSDVYVEVGGPRPSLSDFVIGGGVSEAITDFNDIDMTKINNKSIVINVDGNEYESVLHIQDTIAPVVEFKDFSGFAHLTRKPEDFIVSSEDATNLRYSFETVPDVEKVGSQTVTINVTDEGNNTVSSEVTLTLLEDTEAPIIEGVKDISVFVGGKISYLSGVTISDNCPEGLITNIDHNAVNITVPGTYPVTYTAKDAAGNTTEQTCAVVVRERVYDANEINAIADGVLASILTDGMSQYDKCSAIFTYVKGHVKYLNGSDKNNYLRAAYEGLVEGKGDCFVYASTSKILLTRAGIPNLDIAKIPAKTHHYWNLVDIGDGHGWYHFDTTPRKDHIVIFMWDEPSLMAYSISHNNSHNYDHTIYPVVQ